MHTEWQRPTQAEYETRKILAWLVQHNTNLRDKQGNPDVQPCPYNALMLSRRLARGGDMPDFVEIIKPPIIKVAIVGSRTYPNKQHVIDYVNQLPDNTVVVSGGATGVDTWAEDAARARGLATEIYPVDTTGLPPFPRGRGEFAQRAKARNTLIIEASDRVVAFWSKNPKTGKWSTGTRDSINKARQLGKDVEIVKAEPPGLEFFEGVA